jgi:PleD family two-component response regulator
MCCAYEVLDTLADNTSPRGARDFFDRARRAMIKHSEQQLGFAFGISAGAASFPSDADSPEGLLEAADSAMYQAKYRGKNQFVHSSLESA